MTCHYLLPFHRGSRQGEARRSLAATPRQARAQYEPLVKMYKSSTSEYKALTWNNALRSLAFQLS